jgi:hypothetical protein
MRIHEETSELNASQTSYVVAGLRVGRVSAANLRPIEAPIAVEV